MYLGEQTIGVAGVSKEGGDLAVGGEDSASRWHRSDR